MWTTSGMRLSHELGHLCLEAHGTTQCTTGMLFRQSTWQAVRSQNASPSRPCSHVRRRRPVLHTSSVLVLTPAPATSTKMQFECVPTSHEDSVLASFAYSIPGLIMPLLLPIHARTPAPNLVSAPVARVDVFSHMSSVSAESIAAT